MTTKLATGTECYIPDEEHVWLAAQVVAHDAEKNIVTVQMSGSKEKRVIDFSDKATMKLLGNATTLPIQNQDNGPEGVNDMIKLNYLHEAAILFNVKKRFLGGHPYTYTGNITIAVNPYRWLPDLYAEQKRQQYLELEKEELPPHVYATSVASYKHMVMEEKNQSILVSGESGAGKTETTKILMNHLATIAGGLNNETINRIVEVTPLLESFGNAKTVRNDNSSRFGKFTQLQFNAKRTLVGAKCQTYLLEKTRVVGHEEGERNYHIFYQLLDAPEKERKMLKLSSKTEYKFIGKNTHEKIEGKTDAEHLLATKQALSLIGLTAKEQECLLKTLAGILNLGQLEFEEKAGNDDESKLKATPAVQDVCELMGVTSDALEKAFCTRTMKARTDVYSVPLKADQARDCRDALSKATYAKVFDWLVGRINLSLADDAQMKNHIGVLDIFGFEHFKHNSFEQFCINYANEKLQQKFTQDVFKTVQIEYEEEGISWNHIDFSDNQDVLDVIESKMGIISLLNEELMRPKGNEEGFIGKVSTLHKEDSAHVIEFPRTSRTQFTIKHYATPVTYESVGFLEKHKDALLPDLSDLMRSSSVPFVTQVFPEEAKPSGRRGAGRLKISTVGTQFKESLSQLMENIQSTNVYYVRCIKPNAKKSPTDMDQAMVVSQLRCAGVIEAIRISRRAYPNRLLHEEFTDRFWLFATAFLKLPVTEKCVKIAQAFNLTSPEQYQMGLTKIYFQMGVLEKLNAAKGQLLDKYARKIQVRVIGYATRCKYLHQRRALVKIQALIRCLNAIVRYQRYRMLVIRTQTQWRGRIARRQAFDVKKTAKATVIQSAYRAYVQRSAYHKTRSHIQKVQGRLRMQVQRKRYQEILREKKQETDMNLKLKHLQDRLKQEGDAAVAAGSGKGELSRTKSIVDAEVMQDAGGMIGQLQEDNARLRAELRLYKSNNTELREKADNLRSDREVLIASNHVKTFNFERKIEEQDKKMQVVRKEYETLRAFIATHMPDADVVGDEKKDKKPAATVPAIGFGYFRNIGKKDGEGEPDAPTASQMVKNLEQQLEQTRDETSKFLRASAQRMSRAKFWQPATAAETEDSDSPKRKSILDDALQSVTRPSFFKGTIFDMKKGKPDSITANANVEGETVSLDNLPTRRKSYIKTSSKIA